MRWLDKRLKLYKIGKVNPSTLEQMQRYVKDVRPISNNPLKKLTAIDLQEFLNSVEKPRKREKLFEYLKDALTKAVKNKLIDDDLFDGIDKPKFIRKQSKALTREQEQLFVKACAESNQGDLFLLCLFQGLRLGDALALMYDDVDFDKKTITVNKSIDSLGNVTTPKTPTSIRTLQMFSRTVTLFGQNKQGNVFSYQRKVYQNSMLKICKRLGFDVINIHSLRHTFATRLAEAKQTVQHRHGYSMYDNMWNLKRAY